MRRDGVLRHCAALASALIIGWPLAAGALGLQAPVDLALRLAVEVTPRLELPPAQQAFYAEQLEDALSDAQVIPASAQYVVLVDRNPNVQAVMIFWRSSTGDVVFIGAAPTSTGVRGGFEHFETPTGVFIHSLANPDFRAEGTKNELGVCGYGAKGQRVYDFGWVEARRTWDKRGESAMRLQMHSTDPAVLEPRLGSAQSKGCIRIGSSLNHFIDHYGILDADYEEALAGGRKLWVLEPDRAPTQWSGRYLVVVDSAVATRPSWSPRPQRR
jgi:hypothetical protein